MIKPSSHKSLLLALGAATVISLPVIANAAGDDLNASGLKLRGNGTVDDRQPGAMARNDDIGADGLKRRGDGTIDDDQPGAGFGREHKQLIHGKERNREVLEDGTAVRTRTDTWVTPDGAVVRERTETRSVLPMELRPGSGPSGALTPKAILSVSAAILEP